MSISQLSKGFFLQMKILALVLILGCGTARAAKTTPQDFDIELQNKVTAEALVSVKLVPNGRIEYGYTIKSSTQSLQDIRRFRLQAKIRITEMDMVAAPGWFVGEGSSVEPVDEGVIDDISWNGEGLATLIKPGRELTGFKVTIESLPGIVDFHVQGHTDKDMAEASALSQEDIDMVGDLQDPWRGNSFRGKTIGPNRVPEVIVLPDLIDRLISLKHQSVFLGWISGPGSDGIVKSLDDKLDAAKASIARGQNKAASNQMSAFINELQAQRGKRLNDNAFFLLKVNAEFVISKLGT